MALSKGYPPAKETTEECRPGEPGDHEMVRDGDYFTDEGETEAATHIFQPMRCKRCGHTALWGERLVDNPVYEGEAS